MKGVLAMAHADERYVCHAVHSIFSAAYDAPWADEPRASKLVFIGKGLDAAELSASFNACLATPANYARRAAALRFKVGEQVEFFDGESWVDATVTSHLVRDLATWTPHVLATWTPGVYCTTTVLHGRCATTTCLPVLSRRTRSSATTTRPVM